MNFWQLVELDFFPEGYRVSIDSASFEETRVSTLPTDRTFGRVGRGALRSQPKQQLICRPFYAAVRQPISARELSPPTVTAVFSCAPIFRNTFGLRAPPKTDLLVLTRLSPPRQQRLRRYRLWIALTSPSADNRPRKGKKGVTPRASLGVTRAEEYPGESTLARGTPRYLDGSLCFLGR